MYQTENNNEQKTLRVQIAETRLEPIWNCLVSILSDPKNVIPRLEEYTFKSLSMQKANSKIAEYESQIESLKQRRARLVRVYTDQAISDDDYKSELDECRQRISEAENQITKYQQMLIKREERKDRDTILQKLYMKVKARLENPTYEDKQYILHLFIERINLFYSKNYAEVFFRFPASTNVTGNDGQIIGRGEDSLRLVLHVSVMSLKERQREILSKNINNMRDKGFTSENNPRSKNSNRPVKV